MAVDARSAPVLRRRKLCRAGVSSRRTNNRDVSSKFSRMHMRLRNDGINDAEQNVLHKSSFYRRSAARHSQEAPILPAGLDSPNSEKPKKFFINLTDDSLDFSKYGMWHDKTVPVIDCKHLNNIDELRTERTLKNPTMWKCHCETKSSLLCLSCGKCFCDIHCSEHAKSIVRHPHCLQIRFDLSELPVYCYCCDSIVGNDSKRGHLYALRALVREVMNWKVLCRTRSGKYASEHRTQLERSQEIFFSKAAGYVLKRCFQKWISLARVIGSRSAYSHIRPADNIVRVDIRVTALDSLLTVYITLQPVKFLSVDNLISRSNRLMHGKKSRLSKRQHKLTSDDVRSKKAKTIADHLSFFRQRRELLDVESLINNGSKILKLEPGLCGLRNLGNSCWVNAVVQALSNSPLVQAFYTDKFEDLRKHHLSTASNMNAAPSVNILTSDITNHDTSTFISNNHSISSSGGTHLSCSDEFASTLQHLWSGQLARYTPNSLLQKVWLLYSQFREFRQNDAQEFCLFLLNQLASEKPFGKESPIKDQFSGQLATMMTCHRCGHRSETISDWLGLFSVNLPPAEFVARKAKEQMLAAGYHERDVANWVATATSFCNLTARRAAAKADDANILTHTLETCLEWSRRCEDLHGEDSYLCSNCNARVSASRQTIIKRLPAEYFIVHIVRTTFDPKTQNSRKDQSHVRFPLENLNMTPFVEQNFSEEWLYDLYAVVQHQGRSMIEGHFTCFAMVNNQWVQFNDAALYFSSPEEVQSSQGYLLWYRRVSRKQQTSTDKSFINGNGYGSVAKTQYADLSEVQASMMLDNETRLQHRSCPAAITERKPYMHQSSSHPEAAKPLMHESHVLMLPPIKPIISSIPIDLDASTVTENNRRKVNGFVLL